MFRHSPLLQIQLFLLETFVVKFNIHVASPHAMLLCKTKPIYSVIRLLFSLGEQIMRRTNYVVDL